MQYHESSSRASAHKHLPPIAPIFPAADLASEQIRNVQTAPVSNQGVLSIAEVDRLLEKSGFPELNRSWERFKKLNIPIESLTPESLLRDRIGHCEPLGRFPKLVLTTSLSIGGLLGVSQAGGVVEQLGSPTLITQLFVYGLSVLNLSFLALYGLSYVRRTRVSSFEDIMAREVGFMLTRGNFREVLDGSLKFRSGTAAVRSKLSELWDNLNYKRDINRVGNHIKVDEPTSHSELALQCLREVIGGKSDVTRKHQPGRFASSLIEGKSSINLVLSRYSDILGQIKAGVASLDQCRDLLEFLRDCVVVQGSAGQKFVSSVLARLDGEIIEGSWRSEVWHRDPIVDLTHQEEFYSSASLRGVKAVGRGVRGRLGTFLYHWNPGMTMLDISSSKGRAVRARLVAGTVKSQSGSEITAILVDGVEGSTAVPRDVIHGAIKNYASSLNCPVVIYNSGAHNQVPKRFSKYVGQKGTPIGEVEFSAFYSGERLYIDSFGLPLEPFEYSRGAGRLIGYVEDLKDSDDPVTLSPTLRTKIQSFLRQNIHYVLFGEAVTYSAIISSVYSATLSLSLLIFSGVGFGLNYLFQRRSIGREEVNLSSQT